MTRHVPFLNAAMVSSSSPKCVITAASSSPTARTTLAVRSIATFKTRHSAIPPSATSVHRASPPMEMGAAIHASLNAVTVVPPRVVPPIVRSCHRSSVGTGSVQVWNGATTATPWTGTAAAPLVMWSRDGVAPSPCAQKPAVSRHAVMALPSARKSVTMGMPGGMMGVLSALSTPDSIVRRR